jgi:hypothetical protein
MVASSEWFEYHLTPSEGWVSGSEKLDFGGVKEKATPADRVLTLRLTEEISWSPPAYQYVDVIWTCGDRDRIAELEAVHGRVPEVWKEYAALRKITP